MVNLIGESHYFDDDDVELDRRDNNDVADDHLSNDFPP